jgi:hypothetical protein
MCYECCLKFGLSRNIKNAKKSESEFLDFLVSLLYTTFAKTRLAV